MKITKTGIIWGILSGIAISFCILFFGEFNLIPNIIVGVGSAIFIAIIMSRVDQSSKFPYWKPDEKER